MRVYLIRHPLPVVAAGVCYGSSDLPLAEDAAQCAARLAPLLPPAAQLYSSPLTRCRQLAKLLHAAPRYDERLMEMDFGSWELCTWDEIGRASLDAWAANPLAFVPPGGESVSALCARVDQFIADRRAEACQELVLVSHAGVLKALLAQLAGVPAPDWFTARFDYGAVSLIEDGRLVWCNQ